MVCVRVQKVSRAGVLGASAVAVPAVVMLAVGLWGLDRGGIWRDEAVTYQVARRTVPQIWRLLHGVDAVHGLYYLLMHAVLPLHPGEVVLRLPSVCAATVTAGLVAALGVRLAGRRVGLWAGLLYAVTPLAGHYAQEGRSYALVAAGAAGATLLLVRAVDEGAGAGRPWWRYGGVVAVTCLLHELAVFMLCAHAVTLALLRVSWGVWWRWGRAAGAAVVVLLPLVLVSHGQSRQVEWLPVPDRESAERLLRSFAVGPEGVVFWGCVVLMAAGLWAGRTAVVMAPLMVVPPALLMLLSQVRPLYHERYVLYALAGAPLLIAAGADRLAGLARRRSCSWTITAAGASVVALVFLDLLPLHRQYRTLAHRPDNLAAVSALATREVRPGDPVLFLPSLGRRAALAYPKGFQGARDLALKVPGAQSGTLYGREVGPRELRRRLAAVSRLWVVAEPYALRSRWFPGDPTERAKLLTVAEGFTPSWEYDRPGVALRLYIRRPATGAQATTTPTAAVPLTGSPASPPRPPRPGPP
ncbi:glycosyltransferase family 39 protein [Streptomyces sp. NBC_01485]|uniref:glycosyltransferase family 39 protein n=1 Tax=Streptomyces sp. NBC_01485 TaxID=2903884 RepID=UPI002E380006|nr:glycosyltransferase family 39 protein [Streptomyces sp. NBC_01485]